MGWRKRLLSDVRVGRKTDYKFDSGSVPTVAADTDASPVLDQRDVGRVDRDGTGRPRKVIISRVNQTVNREKVYVKYNSANVSVV